MNPLPNKLLIISNWAPPMVGASLSLYNLFSQLSQKSYSILTNYSNISTGAEKGGLWLPCDYFFFNHAPIRQAQIHKPPLHNYATQKKKASSLFHHLAGKTETILRHFLPLKILYLTYSVTQAIIGFYFTGKKITSKEGITMLMGTSDNGPALISSYLLSRSTKLPLCYFLFDLYMGYRLDPPTNWLAKYFEPKIISAAKIIFVTNDGTKEHYQLRYPQCKEKFRAIYNSVFIDQYQKLNRNYNPTPPFTIVFTGHVYWPQEQSIMNMIKAMSLLKDFPVQLKLYIPRPNFRIQNAVKDSSRIQLLVASQSEMPQIQNSATLLFLPFAWNTDGPEIIATATPAKFTDYLGAGRPMLIHAPNYSYVARYARKHDLGLVVDQNNIGILANTIRNFLQNPKSGQHYINNALQIFYQNHNAVKNAELLKQGINEL